MNVFGVRCRDAHSWLESFGNWIAINITTHAPSSSSFVVSDAVCSAFAAVIWATNW